MGLTSKDIDELIEVEILLCEKLKVIRDKVEKIHLKSNISTTTGVSVSAAGFVSTVAGIFLAPATAGLSLSLTIGGIAASIGGATTCIATDITKNIFNKKLIKELEVLLEARLEKYHTLGKKIKDALTYGKSVTGIVGSSVAAITLVDVSKFLYINRTIYGIEHYGTAVLVAKQTDSVIRTVLNKGLANVGAKIGARTFFVGFGAVFIALDTISLVKSWTNEPKLVSHINSIIKEIEEKVEELRSL